jgi:hypothetical protein
MSAEPAPWTADHLAPAIEAAGVALWSRIVDRGRRPSGSARREPPVDFPDCLKVERSP